MNGPGGCAPLGECAWKMRSSPPSSGAPWVIGSRCGSPQPSDVTRPRTRMISRWPLMWERSVSTLVTPSTGLCGPALPSGCGGPPACCAPCCCPACGGCPACGCWPAGAGGAAGGRAPAAGGGCCGAAGALSRDGGRRAVRANNLDRVMASSLTALKRRWLTDCDLPVVPTIAPVVPSAVAPSAIAPAAVAPAAIAPPGQPRRGIDGDNRRAVRGVLLQRAGDVAANRLQAVPYRIGRLGGWGGRRRCIGSGQAPRQTGGTRPEQF